MRALLLLFAAALTACAGVSTRVAQAPRLHEDSPGEFADYQLMKRVAPGESSVDPARYRAAAAHAASMRHYSARAGRFVDGTTVAKAAAPAWESLGPGNTAGRTRTLEFDPRDANHLYAAGVSGGIWESFDGGENWTTRSDAAANINIGSLAIDPVEPDTIYAGTGELYRNNDQPVSSMWGQGILRSTDGGRTFQQLVATANDDFRYVADLAISPHDHNRVYAATNSGIWRSNDRGATFTRVLRPQNASGDALYEGCNDLLFPAGHDGDYLLAACASRSTDDRYYLPGTVLPPGCNGPCPAAVFLNTDAAGAGTWTSVLTEPAMGRTTLDFARSRPDTIYAVSASIVPGFDRDHDGTGDYNNGLDAVWRSTDGGHTWEARVRNNSADALSTYLLSYAETIEYALCGNSKFIYGAGWYNQAIAVDPTNPDRVWVAGMDQYRSDDGGRTFGKASYWFNFGVTDTGIHADQHLLKFHPQYDGVNNRRLYATNDGGVTVTEDATVAVSRGTTAACNVTDGRVAWRRLTHNLATAQFYTGAVTASGDYWLGGAQDNGTLSRFAATPPDVWRHIFGGDGGFVAIDPRNSSVIYSSAQNISLGRSTDGGTSFADATIGFADSTVFTVPYVLDPSAPDRLYAGGTRVWRTDNQGRNWRVVSAAFGSSAYANRVSAIAVARTNPDRMLAGNQVGIFYNTAATASIATTVWPRVSPRAGWVSSLSFDPHDASIAYATYSSFGGAHVWRSADAGATWSAIDGAGDGALPDVPVHTLAVDPGDSRRLFIGTDIGVFVSIDGGAHWAVENTGFANVITESLVTAAGSATVPPQLFAFTYGRGAWRVPLAQLSGTADYRIGADTSGTFYDPAQDGHGWVIDSFVSGGVTTVIAAWYVYLNGEQRWLIGTGPATANEARVQLYAASGGRFPPAFDPAQVTLTPWGEATLRFDDRDHATASWTTSVAGFSNGSMPLARLTQPANPVAGESATAHLAACHSGTWYNAQQSGHGLQVEVLGAEPSRQLLAIWYTYLDGKQRWLIGTGPVSGDRATVALVTTRGGQFPPAFNAASVVREPWGSLTFRAIDGDHAHIDWTSSAAGFNDGSLDLVRLTGQLGRACP